MAKRDSFVFYRSFYECIKELPQKSAYPLLMALCEYAIEGNESNLKGLEAGIFAMMKPQIDANNKKYENGKKGGRPRKSNNNQTETNGIEKDGGINNQIEINGYENDSENSNQEETETEPNENVNVNDNDNDIHPISPAENFEVFWSAYPNKQRRQLTEKAYIDLLMTGKVTEQDLIDTASNYAEAVKITGDKMYLPNNFLDKGVFDDYLLGNYIKPEEKKPKNQAMDFPQREYDFEKLEREIVSN